MGGTCMQVNRDKADGQWLPIFKEEFVDFQLSAS